MCIRDRHHSPGRTVYPLARRANFQVRGKVFLKCIVTRKMFLGGRAIRPNEITFPRPENKPQTQQFEKKLYFSVKRRKNPPFLASNRGTTTAELRHLSVNFSLDFSFSTKVTENC